MQKLTWFTVLLIGITGAVPTSAQESVIEASYAWAYETEVGNSDHLMGITATFTNTGPDNLDGLNFVLWSAPELVVVPGQNTLSLGSLTAGESRSVVWEVEYFGAAYPPDSPLILQVEGSAVGSANEPVPVPVIRTGEANQ